MSTFSDKTYDAKTYSNLRPTYPVSLYETIRQYIGLKDGEKVDAAVDIGCGPGEATGEIAKRIAKKAFGLDPSEVMLAQAKERNAGIDNIHWIVGDDTTLTAQSSKHSVDLVTVAEAAHWFTYPDFWEAVQHVLKPDGVLAYWGYYDFAFEGYPESVAIINSFGATKVEPYWGAGLHLLRNLYRDLEPPSNLFNDITIFRHDGVDALTGPSTSQKVPFELVKHDITVCDALQLLTTYSAYHNWKQANPDKPDVFDQTCQELLDATGLEPDSKVTVRTSTVLILARNKSE